jgi:hypothetical protein
MRKALDGKVIYYTHKVLTTLPAKEAVSKVIGSEVQIYIQLKIATCPWWIS